MRIIKYLISILKKTEIFCFELKRNKINKIFNDLVRSDTNDNNLKKGNILVDGLWDHPHHWLRLIIFINAAKKITPSISLGIICLKFKIESLLKDADNSAITVDIPRIKIINFIKLSRSLYLPIISSRTEKTTIIIAQ